MSSYDNRQLRYFNISKFIVCNRGVCGGWRLGGHPEQNFQELTPISCNLGQSRIISVTFSIAILLEYLGNKSQTSHWGVWGSPPERFPNIDPYFRQSGAF